MRGLVIAALFLAAPAFAGEPGNPAAVTDAFEEALHRGDREGVLRLLAPDVLIYESGGQEASRDEYAQHHLGEDIAFMASAKMQKLSQSQAVDGALAVVTTRTRMTGTAGGKPLDLLGTETMVLRKTEGAWRISHIHWSSRRASAKP